MATIIPAPIQTLWWTVVDLPQDPEPEFGGMRGEQGPTSLPGRIQASRSRSGIPHSATPARDDGNGGSDIPARVSRTVAVARPHEMPCKQGDAPVAEDICTRSQIRHVEERVGGIMPVTKIPMHNSWLRS